MKIIIKIIKKHLLIWAGLITAINCQMNVSAKSVEKTAEDAKSGVVQVNTVFVDDNSEKHIVCGGTGFIVGAEDGTEYVITCNHFINPDTELKEDAFKYYEISNKDDAWSKITLTAEVVIEEDVVLTATVVNTSDELDLVVLELPQPINTRKPLTFLTSENYDVSTLPYKVTDSVYAMGFPAAVSYDSENQYYLDSQVAMVSGNIVNILSKDGIQIIESNLAIDDNNIGGPLVNENGYVIGMNISAQDGMYACSLDSTKIVKILDGLGVEYSKVYEVPKEKEPEKPTEKVVVVKENTIPIWLIVTICATVVAVVAGIVTIIIVKLKHKGNSEPAKKKKKKKIEDDEKNEAITKYVDKTQENTIRSLGISSENGSDTMLLQANSNSSETTVLNVSNSMSEKLKIGTLIRLKTGEKIDINKSYFMLGKDNLHVDYCIKDNGTVSRQHAIIRQAKEGIYLEDNNSTNGTWLNGKKVTYGRAELLRNGDLIKISNEEFEYQV